MRPPPRLAAYRRAEAQAVQTPFLGIAVVLIVVAASFWLSRRAAASFPDKPEALRAALAPLKKPRLALGALSIFLYVGAEVSIGSLLINYLMQANTLGVDAATGGRLISLYWGGAMVGRFLGSAVLRRVAAGTVLAACALGAACAGLGLGGKRRHGRRGGRACRRPLQLDHVSDDLRARDRESRRRDAARLGHPLPRDCRRRGGAGRDRLCRRQFRPCGGAVRAGGVLSLDRRLWRTDAIGRSRYQSGGRSGAMKQRRLGRTGLSISEIGFGCGPTAGLMVRGDAAARRDAVARALALGIDYFDTAPVYGDTLSEQYLGETLRELGAQPMIATKIALELADLVDIAGAVTRSVEASIARLGVPSARARPAS